MQASTCCTILLSPHLKSKGNVLKKSQDRVFLSDAERMIHSEPKQDQNEQTNVTKNISPEELNLCTSDSITIALLGMYETTISNEKQIDDTCININESQVNFFSFPNLSGLKDVERFRQLFVGTNASVNQEPTTPICSSKSCRQTGI